MQELTCKHCGGDLETWNVEGEGLYGRCTHCKATYLIEEVKRSHIVVDVHMPQGRGLPGAPALSRRGVVGGVGAVVAAVVVGSIALPLLVGPRHRRGKAARSIAPVWNIGGKGPGPGQFPDSIGNLTIDGQGRSCVTISLSPLVQLFDADGRFLARWVTASGNARLLAALPGGDLILDGPGGFERRDPMTGRIVAKIQKPDEKTTGGREQTATTPDGGFAMYYGRDSLLGLDPKPDVPDDRIVYFGPDGAMGRTIGPLIGKVFRPDPAIPQMPDISAMAIDGTGTIYLLFHKQKDYDTREGIYAFNPDGVFLRKIEIAQKFYGMLAATADGTLYHADPWMTQITRIKGAESTTIDTADLKTDPSTEVGMPNEIAAFPNGDLGVTTGSERYLRLRWPETS